jgi:hypothetical protein
MTEPKLKVGSIIVNSIIISIAIFMLCVAVAAGEEIGGSKAWKIYRQQAVEHQCATWEVKPDGSTEFKWLEKQQ